MPKSGKSSFGKLLNRLQMVNKLLHKGTFEKDFETPVVVNFQLKKYGIYRLMLTKTKQILAWKPYEGIRTFPLSFFPFFFFF